MAQNENSTFNRSTQMQAVTTIILACSDLTRNAGPHIDLKLEQINLGFDFQAMLEQLPEDGSRLAFILWRDEARPRFNVFENSNLI
jgi:hypothetical protein